MSTPRGRDRAMAFRSAPDGDRTLPADIEAERSCLGALLIDRDAIVAVAPWLTSRQFYLEKHAWVYDAVLACYAARTPPDIRTVSDELRRQNRLDVLGGVSYLVELATATPTAVHVAFYARIVERTAILRRLIAAGGAVAALGYDEARHGDLETVLAAAAQTIADVAATKPERSLVPLADALDAYHGLLTARVAAATDGTTAALDGVPTGLRDLDALVQRLMPGITLVGARPGVGKTSFLRHLALQAARAGKTVAFFSLEMDLTAQVESFIAMESDVPVLALRTGTLREADLAAVAHAMGRLSTLPIVIDDTPGQAVGTLHHKVMALQARNGVDLILIDYLQLLTTPGQRETRTLQITEITQGLLALSKAAHVPVVAASQLSRAIEQRAGHVPTMADFREGGSQEQDAYLVLALAREELSDPATDRVGIMDVHVLKHRFGPCGIVPLRYHKRVGTFADLESWQPAGGA